MGDEDITELKGMMVPGEPAPSSHNISEGWQLINGVRTSKYTTGILSTSGWLPISKISGTPQDLNIAQVSQEESTVVASPSDAEEEREADEVDSTPWLDDKYYDHYGYLDYVSRQAKSPPNDKKKLLPVDAVNTSDVPRRTKTYASLKKLPSAHEEDMTDMSSNEAKEWELFGDSTRPPRLNFAAPTKLVIRLRNTSTSEQKTLTFPNMERKDIDWTSAAHITEITKWRNETLLRNGINIQQQNLPYTPTEDAWLNILHRKLRGAVEAGHMFKCPTHDHMREAFNAHFEGKTLKAADGMDAPPRTSRSVSGFAQKLSTGTYLEDRRIIRGLLERKKPKEIYLPVITEEELERFMEDDTVVIDDPNDVGKNWATIKDVNTERQVFQE
ncbi:hect-domain-containing protein [Pyrenophora seminiperda CCB06]|uniref:Hect-domain-containing protein n=1 Tax=Pyrenophora seminiperda CCB06 TaxID=1302712 RepID=A0A3M7MJ27_9PLEO|nr:hect-domain-containing protein [Pyrenophora seminiperda CCB06]